MESGLLLLLASMSHGRSPVLRTLAEVGWCALRRLGPRGHLVGLERAWRSLIRLRVDGVLGLWLVEGGSRGHVIDGAVGARRYRWCCWC